MMKKAIWPLVILVPVTCLMGQEWWNKKPYYEWSVREAQRLLISSPWAAEVRGRILNIESANDLRTALGAGRPRTYTPWFRVLFLSAKPVQLAISRSSDPAKSPQVTLEQFPAAADETHIILALRWDNETSQSRVEYQSRAAWQRIMLNLRTTDLERTTWLVSGSGKKVYLERYDAPNDVFGARLYFPRKLPDGSHFLKAGDRELTFQSTIVQMGEGIVP